MLVTLLPNRPNLLALFSHYRPRYSLENCSFIHLKFIHSYTQLFSRVLSHGLQWGNKMPQGGTRSIHDGWGGGGGGSDGASYCKSKKIHKPETLDKKNTWHQNFQPKKIQELNTSILIYSIKQNFLMHDFALISLRNWYVC